MSPKSAGDTGISAHITADSLIIPTLHAWAFYLEDQGNSPHTVKAFIADLKLLAQRLTADRTLGSITTADINNFLDWLQNGRGVPCSPKTLSRRTTSVKAFFRWLHQNGVILVDPAEKVLHKAVISPLAVVLTPDEVEQVLEAANFHRRAARPDARPYVLAALLLATGIKKGECLAIAPNHIDFETPDGPILFVRYSSPQYRYKERKIALPESWIAAYHEYTAQYSPGERLFPWSPRRLEYLLEDLSEEAGLVKHLSFDMCRWTCALTDWQNGVDPVQIRQKLGISKIQWREVSQKLELLAEQA